MKITDKALWNKIAKITGKDLTGWEDVKGDKIKLGRAFDRFMKASYYEEYYIDLWDLHIEKDEEGNYL